MSNDAIALPQPEWNWMGLQPGTASWRAAFEQLGDWVLWYTETYELWQSMPVCWYEHSRLVEDLRALRSHHDSVCVDGPAEASARDFADWMTARREWEQTVLGLDPRDHGGCSGLAHVPPPDTTVAGRRDRLKRMGQGLKAMLDTTLPGGERRG